MASTNQYLATLVNANSGTEFETVAASQTAQVLGATGAAGDFLRKVIIVPETTSMGAVTLLDGAASTVLHAAATVGAPLTPIVLELGMKCVTAWKITTSTNVHVYAVGNFT
jgi:hypothetical protein